MSLKETVLKNRSYRRFYQDRKVSVKELEELVDIARNVASGANRQPLRYKVVCDASDNEKVFSTLKWAAALTDWDGPKEGEKPAGYIHDTAVPFDCAGIQEMTLEQLHRLILFISYRKGTGWLHVCKC